jgi:hypothetical protein
MLSQSHYGQSAARPMPAEAEIQAEEAAVATWMSNESSVVNNEQPDGSHAGGNSPRNFDICHYGGHSI